MYTTEWGAGGVTRSKFRLKKRKGNFLLRSVSTTFVVYSRVTRLSSSPRIRESSIPRINVRITQWQITCGRLASIKLVLLRFFTGPSPPSVSAADASSWYCMGGCCSDSTAGGRDLTSSFLVDTYGRPPAARQDWVVAEHLHQTSVAADGEKMRHSSHFLQSSSKTYFFYMLLIEKESK